MHHDCMVKCAEVEKKCTKCQKDLKFEDILKIEYAFEAIEIQSFKKEENTDIQMVNRFNEIRQGELRQQLQYEKDHYKALEQIKQQQRQLCGDLLNIGNNQFEKNKFVSDIDQYYQNLAINHIQIEEGIQNIEDLKTQFNQQQSLQQVELDSFKNENEKLTEEVQMQKTQNESLEFDHAELVQENKTLKLYLGSNETWNFSLKNQHEEINNLKQKNNELNKVNEKYKEEVELLQGTINSLLDGKGANDDNKEMQRQKDYNLKLENQVKSLKNIRTKYETEFAKVQGTSQELTNQKDHNNRLQQQVQKLTTAFQKLFADMKTGCNKLVNGVNYQQTKRISEEEIGNQLIVT